MIGKRLRGRRKQIRVTQSLTNIIELGSPFVVYVHPSRSGCFTFANTEVRTFWANRSNLLTKSFEPLHFKVPTY